MLSRQAPLLLALEMIASSISPSLAQTPVQPLPDRQVLAIADALAPGDTPGRKFVLRYAEIVRGRIGKLDDLERFLTSGSEPVCNLFCEKRVTPGFFYGATTGPSDVIRYVFGHTCYGVMPDARHKGVALKDLNAALGADNWDLQGKLSEYDKSVARTAISDALKDYIGTNDLSSSKRDVLLRKEFKRVHDLWRSAFGGGSPVTNVLPPIWPAGMDAAAAEACKNSTFDKSLLTK